MCCVIDEAIGQAGRQAGGQTEVRLKDPTRDRTNSCAHRSKQRACARACSHLALLELRDDEVADALASASRANLQVKMNRSPGQMRYDRRRTVPRMTTMLSGFSAALFLACVSFVSMLQHTRGDGGSRTRGDWWPRSPSREAKPSRTSC